MEPPPLSLDTEVVQVQYKDQYGASSVPIYQSATFKQPSLDEFGAYDYTRSGNPTRSALESHLERIMRGATRTFAVNSGMSALDVVARLVKPGQRIIAGLDLYGGSNRLLTYLSRNGGVAVRHIDTRDMAAVKAELATAEGGEVALVLLETPTNPLLQVCDVRSIAAAAHAAFPQCLVMVDNTMMSPLLMNPFELGADVWYESVTKYLCGHHDVMAGVIAVQDKALADRIFFVINSIGSGIAPMDAFLTLRGIKTLGVRLKQQQSNAEVIAQWLQDNTSFDVYYPGLKSHPQYALHASMAKGAGSVMSFRTHSVEKSRKFVNACKLYGISVSFGAVNSLISMPCLMSHASIDAKTREERGLHEDLVRLCLGIEDVGDLLDDLKNAYKACQD